MKSIALNINNCNDLGFIYDKQNNYSYAFHKLHSNIDKINDKKFENYITKQFNLTDIEFRSLKSDVLVRNEQTKTNKNNQEKRIAKLIQDIQEIKHSNKISKNNITSIKFKKHKKIKELEDSLQRDITFGSKNILRELTKLHNKIKIIENDNGKTLEQKEELLADNKLKIEEKIELWKCNRILHCFIIGEANYKGNRFFKFLFEDNKIIYKPNKNKKVEIKFSCSKKQQQQLQKLQVLINQKEIPVTVRLSTKQICLSFDNEILSGYYIDKKEIRKEVNEINKKYLSPEQKSEIIKNVYKKYKQNLIQKKIIGKISNRYMAVDLNSHYIGYCIADKGENGIEKIIEKGVIDLSGLDKKLRLPSNNPLKIKQNNKLKNELCNSLKHLFSISNHYKCAYFVKEDIDSIGKKESSHSNEANRKVKNIWHRTITEWQIKKRCIENGIELIQVIPAYTSFIGNVMYDNFDATNSAIEICRRGMFKFKKGLFYPTITGTISDTMSRIIEKNNSRDAQIFKDCESWMQLYKTATHNGLRWRWDWSDIKKSYSVFSIDNIKSKVNIVKFIN